MSASEFSSTFDAPREQQLDVARAKIDDEWLRSRGELVRHYDAAYAALVCKMYGDFARGWLWAPNYTAAAEGGAPSGFQFNVSPRAPPFAVPFSRDALFSGVLCFPLAAGDRSALSMRTKELAGVEHFVDSRSKVSKRLVEQIDENLHLAGATGNQDNFAGILWSYQTSPAQFYCAVQAHNPELSRRAYALIEENEPESFECVREFADALIAEHRVFKADLAHREETGNSFEINELRRSAFSELDEIAECASDEVATSRSAHRSRRHGRRSAAATATAARTAAGELRAPYKTWYELFFQDEKMRALAHQQAEHRARLVCQTMIAAGLGPVCERGTEAEMVQAVLENASTVNNAVNCIEQVDCADRHSDVVYLDNLTSAWNVTGGGVLVRSAAHDKFSLLPGTLDQLGFAGPERKTRFVGFATSTGPRYSSRLLAHDPALLGADVKPEPAQRELLWSAQAPAATATAARPLAHPLLHTANWRVRSKSWRDWERRCGSRHRSGIALKAIRLRVAEPHADPADEANETIYNITQ